MSGTEYLGARRVRRGDRLDYGIKKKSGRYPWGSGEDDYQRSQDFYAYVNEMKSKGIPDKEIAVAIGLAAPDDDGFSVAQLRATRTIAKEEIVREQTNRAVALRDKGTSIKAISEDLGIPTPTVRLRLKNSENFKESTLRNTANVLKKNVDEHDIVDIGIGVEHHLGVSPEKLKAAVGILSDEGYRVYTLQTPQVGGRNRTNQQVIVKPDTTYGMAKRMTDKIHTMGDFTEDDGQTFLGIHAPLNVSAKRIQVKFKEDGGADQDGLIYVRPGVDDLSMGKNTYTQVRIAVNGTHYMKGMAILKDDLPPGVDLVYHTPKPRGTPILGDSNNTVLKNQTGDADNPFGSIIKRQIVDADPKTGKERLKSALNIINEEGDWHDWRTSLPSQMLAKQPHALIKSQLNLTRDQVRDRLAEINTITNAVVRKKALEDYADQIDSDAVDLRAAAMPRQRTQVIIPMPKMNKGEIYAPQFETGEKVILVRYPHGGRFEIPEVTVNNNSRIAKKLLGNAPDAIGIHPAVAEKLSGADFDGDAVVVIPNRSGKIKGSQSMGSQAKVFEDGLKNFDPKRKYGGYQQIGTDAKGNPIGNFKLMTNTGREMGMITNLVTDMSIQGAKPDHVLRAVKHSMVVIDAEKHKLDYKKSEQDNGIKQLRELYQMSMLPDGRVKIGGATTLLSKATAEVRVPDRKLRTAAKGGPIDPKTGAKRYEPTGKVRNLYDPKTRTYMDGKDGRPLITVPLESKPKRLELADDAFSLVRDPADPVERLYAEHANEMKSLANAARLKAYHTPNPPTNKKATVFYKTEVDKLVADQKAAEKQKPLDRRAHVIAGSTVKAKRLEDPTLSADPDRLKKIERGALKAARDRLGLEKPVIDISDRQWDAIMAGAVSPSRLTKILAYADPKQVAQHAMPKANPVMTKAISSRAKAMLNAGATNADVAAALGISPSTLRAALLRGDL